MTDVVLFNEIVCENGKKIAVITLNSPKSLNALSGAMIDLLYPKLIDWQKRQDIAAVFLQGEGDKAFCAGGDIVHLYKAMKSKSNDQGEIITSFKDIDMPEIECYFTQEYKLDYLIHTFKKPFVVWGNGIVMGGGLGMLAGASHRVVTENSRIAMPEVSIGLFPDVGASYFLNKMPPACGLFLALTGTSINAADAKYCSLADFFVEQNDKEDFLKQLQQVNWEDTEQLNHDMLSKLLAQFEQKSIALQPVSLIESHQALITRLIEKDNLKDIVDAISKEETQEKWLMRAQKSLENGSALSTQLAYLQLQKGKELTLADCFRMELNLAVKSACFGEFLEGVRALLIDKDNSPKWKFESVDLIDQNIVHWFFESKWSESEHPLANLDRAEC